MRKEDVPKTGVICYIKEVLRGNRNLRIVMILLAGIWIVTGTRLITEKLIYRERNLKEAMAVAKPGGMNSSLSFVAKLQETYLTENDQKEIIVFAAEKLGLELLSEPESFADGKRNGFFYRKKAKNAETCIKLIGTEDIPRAYYLIITLGLQDDDGDSVMYYRGVMDGMADELAVLEEQISVQLAGRFYYNMSPAAKAHLTERILRKLGCEIVCENREESFYTVYAYTKGMDEYVLSGKDRINVQLAIYYDEINDETILCVASPVITGELVNAR